MSHSLAWQDRCVHCRTRKQVPALRRLCRFCFANESVRNLYPPRRRHRPWGSKDLDYAAANVKRAGPRQVGLILRRSAASVRSAVGYHHPQPRMVQRQDLQERLRSRLAGLTREGRSAREIARMLQCNESTVYRWQRAMQVKPLAWSANKRATALKRLRRQFDRAGVRSLVEYRTQAARRLAARHGWPMAETRTQLAILQALEIGPATVREILLRRALPVSRYRTVRWRMVIRCMASRGLVRRAGRSGRCLLFCLAVAKELPSRRLRVDGTAPDADDPPRCHRLLLDG